jgi:Putative auto-transporter adhesin, head GIN domain
MKLSITILLTSCIVAFICFISCNKESSNPLTRVFEVTGFNKIIAGDDHEIIITKGTAFSVQAKGDAADLDDLRMLVNGGTLKIDYPSYDNYRKRVHIVITMPELAAVEFSGAAYGSISGFQQLVSLAVNLSGSTNFNINTNTTLMDADVSGNATLIINGTVKSIIANISGQARYHGYGLMEIDNAVVKASEEASVQIAVGRLFIADVSGESKIYYKGNPVTKNITQTGMGSLINE